MRSMMLVKSAENLGRPPKELMDAMAKVSKEAAKANTMVDSGVLAPTSMSQRVRLSRGNLTVLDGPFTEAKEVVGGYAQFGFKTREEATEAAVRFMELHQRQCPGCQGETEIRHRGHTLLPTNSGNLLPRHLPTFSQKNASENSPHSRATNH